MPQNSGSFHQFFWSKRFFFYNSRRNISFQPVKSPYFCVGQPKKNRSKRTSEKSRYFWTCKATECIISLNFENGALYFGKRKYRKHQIFRSQTKKFKPQKTSVDHEITSIYIKTGCNGRAILRILKCSECEIG